MLKSKTLFTLCIIVVCGCSSVKAPKESVPRRKAIATDAFGGWVTISLKTNQNSIQGEFIAVASDSVYIMIDNEVQLVSRADINNARVIFFNTESGSYGVWTFLNSLATISNGYFLIFTLPLNLITGISTTTGESKRINYYDYPALTWEELNKYARFPQGIPEQLDIKEIKPRSIVDHE